MTPGRAQIRILESSRAKIAASLPAATTTRPHSSSPESSPLNSNREKLFVGALDVAPPLLLRLPAGVGAGGCPTLCTVVVLV